MVLTAEESYLDEEEDQEEEKEEALSVKLNAKSGKRGPVPRVKKNDRNWQT